MLSTQAPIYILRRRPPQQLTAPTPLPSAVLGDRATRDLLASREPRAALAAPAPHGRAAMGPAATGTVRFVPKPFQSPDLHWAFFFLIVFKTDFMWSQNETMIVN